MSIGFAKISKIPTEKKIYRHNPIKIVKILVIWRYRCYNTLARKQIHTRKQGGKYVRKRQTFRYEKAAGEMPRVLKADRLGDQPARTDPA